MMALVGTGSEVRDLDASPRQMSVTERLQSEKNRLEERLVQVNFALEQLQEDPKIQRAIDALSRLGHF